MIIRNFIKKYDCIDTIVLFLRLCLISRQPFHGFFTISGMQVAYGFIKKMIVLYVRKHYKITRLLGRQESSNIRHYIIIIETLCFTRYPIDPTLFT